MRMAFVILHRWVGLAIAAFLFIAGLTGAVISWDHELDDWLNPHLRITTTTGQAMPAAELAALIKARDPRVQIYRLPMHAEPGETVEVIVQPRRDPVTGRLYELGYNQVFLDPVIGTEIGRRQWGQAWPITRETLVSFLYRLHYTLHIPEMLGIDRWGVWLMGAIAVLWMLDSFVGFYLTLPTSKPANQSRHAAVARQLAKGFWSRWKPAWRIKTTGSAYRITFDLHRAVSLWTWAMLFMLAFTAFSLNLYREVFYPIMSMVSQVTPDPYSQRKPAGRHEPIEPVVGIEQVHDLARLEGLRRGWSEPVGSIGYNQSYGVYSIRFYRPGDEHGAAGVGPAMLFYDGRDGRLLGDEQPWVGTAADIFVQAQFPIHSGRILGLPGRILISLMGLVVAMLSVTGVVIWWRKRAARVSVRRKSVPADALPSPAE